MHWAGFILFILLCVAVDMGAFERRARAVTFGRALLWSAAWFALALLFAGLLWRLRGSEDAVQFATVGQHREQPRDAASVRDPSYTRNRASAQRRR